MSDPKFENFFELRWPLRTYACTVCVFMRIHAELWLLFFLCYVDPASFVEEVLFSFLRGLKRRGATIPTVKGIARHSCP